MTHYHQTGVSDPSASIAVNHNRLKQYGDSFYLKDKTHFEIELFNPKTTKVLTKIYMNGVSISNSGIVLRPGQRVFLERWLDEAKKFLFETYSVENSTDAAKAIQNNGKIRIEFYDELIVQYYQPTGYDWNVNTMFGSPSVGNDLNRSLCYFSSDIGSVSSIAANVETNIETGRTEKGETSNQHFVSDNSTYTSWISKSIDLQILPESQKPVEAQTIRNYCHSCGSRMKSQGWKFCPTCGTKI